MRCRTRVRVGPCPRGRRRTDPSLGAEFRAAEQEERLLGGLSAACRRPAGNVPNLPFQGWLLPLIQRVSEWHLFASHRLRIPVTLHELTARISPTICCSSCSSANARAGHRSGSLCVLSSGMRVGLVFDKAPITDASEQRRRVHCGPDPGLHGNTSALCLT